MKFHLLSVACLVGLLWACGTESTDPREFSNNLNLLSPQDSSEVILDKSDDDSLILKWDEPTDISGALTYTAILDLDKNFSAGNGSVLRVEIEDDSMVGFSYNDISSLSIFSSKSVDTLYYTVFVRNSSEEIRSKDIHRFTLKLID
jgi:hypothetical protein